MQKDKIIRRGDIYYANLDLVVGSEQGGLRLALIIQNNIGNACGPTVIVTPLTRNLQKKPLPTHVLIPKASNLAGDSIVLAEQIRTIDRSRLLSYIGHIDSDEDIWADINKALEISIFNSDRSEQ